MRIERTGRKTDDRRRLGVGVRKMENLAGGKQKRGLIKKMEKEEFVHHNRI